MSQEELVEKYTKLLEERDKKVKLYEQAKTEDKALKKQGLEILKEHGFETLKDIPLMQEKKKELEKQMKQDIDKAEKDIVAINTYLEERDSILEQ